ncbi:MAG: outer membrane beta-barrel protein [Gemmatimonadota bacterium]
MKGTTMVIRALLISLLLATMSSSAAAQGTVTLSLAGGAALPVASFGEATNLGWHGQLSIGLSSLMQPIGLRLDVAHYRFEADSAAATTAVTPATLNLSYRLPMTDSPLSPYLIAGAGVYRVECVDDVGCDTDHRFGWSAGLGTRVAALRMKWFLESRFHAAGNVRFVPFTLGLTF